MKVIFSSDFKTDLLDAESRYAAISEKLGADFHDRVQEAVLVIAKLGGGDHFGPHGFPCRRCRPFPFVVYYEVVADTLYIIGLIHERRHPDFLRERRELG